MSGKFNGKNLKAIREAKHITQEALAELADLTDRYLRELERGSRDNPSAALLFRVSHVLEVQMEELMEIIADEETL